MNCEDGTKKFYTGDSNEVFGSISFNTDLNTLENYYHYSAYEGNSEIYKILDNGTIQLIAVYNTMCDNKSTFVVYENPKYTKILDLIRSEKEAEMKRSAEQRAHPDTTGGLF